MRERERTTERRETVHEEVSGHFDADHLKAIHQHIFQDVYEWAGTTRGDTITLEGETFNVARAFPGMSKGSTDFLPSAYVERGLDYVAAQANTPAARSSDREEFARAAAEVFSALNHAHPFREGNGRTQRVFMEQLADRAGHTLDFRGITGERMVEASVEASQGNDEPLCAIIAESIDPERVALRLQALQTLEQSGHAAADFWIETAQPGQRIEGAVMSKHPDHCSVVTSENHLIILPASALPDHAQVNKPVSFVFEDKPAPAQDSGDFADRVAAQQAELAEMEQMLETLPPDVRAAFEEQLAASRQAVAALQPEAERIIQQKQADCLEDAKVLALKESPLTKEEAQRLKDCVETALGPEKMAAMERGEAVAIPGLSKVERHDFAVAYLEAREQFGENHRDAKHLHHGQAVDLEQETRREARGHEERGLDWD